MNYFLLLALLEILGPFIFFQMVSSVMSFVFRRGPFTIPKLYFHRVLGEFINKCRGSIICLKVLEEKTKTLQFRSAAGQKKSLKGGCLSDRK